MNRGDMITIFVRSCHPVPSCRLIPNSIILSGSEALTLRVDVSECNVRKHLRASVPDNPTWWGEGKSKVNNANIRVYISYSLFVQSAFDPGDSGASRELSTSTNLPSLPPHMFISKKEKSSTCNSNLFDVDYIRPFAAFSHKFGLPISTIEKGRDCMIPIVLVALKWWWPMPKFLGSADRVLVCTSGSPNITTC